MRASGWMWGMLLLASPLAQAWDVRIEGQPVALLPGGTGEFEIVVTRGAGDPFSFYSSAFYEPENSLPFLRPFFFASASGPRCSVGFIDFLPPPDYLGSFQVTPVAVGETVRCRIGVVAAEDAAPGLYPVSLGGGAGGIPFAVLVLAPNAMATSVPTGTPWAWMVLVLLVACSVRRLR